LLLFFKKEGLSSYRYAARAKYRSSTACAGPSSRTRPWSIQITRVHQSKTA
jgi:hypothetical protein